MAEYINSYFSKEDKILSLNETRGYYFIPKFVISNHVIQGSIVHTSNDIDEIIKKLKENDLLYLFISRSKYFSQHTRKTVLMNEEILKKYFKLLHTNGVCWLYKIK